MMERIKRALELAEAARTGMPGAPAAPGSRARPMEHAEPGRADAAVRGLRLESIPTTAIAPEVLERHRLIDARVPGASLAAYRMLRTQVLQRMRERNWNRLAVVSPGAGDGKTVTALNLGAAVSMEGRHPVAVVDFDLRRPRLHECFGLSPTAGVDAVLRGRLELQEVWFRPSCYPDMVVVPGAGPVSDSSELLSGPGPAELVRRLQALDDRILVIMDLPPVLSADDMLAIAPTTVDCALLVVSEGRTPREDVTRTLDLLQHIPIVGTVLNASRDDAGRYY